MTHKCEIGRSFTDYSDTFLNWMFFFFFKQHVLTMSWNGNSSRFVLSSVFLNVNECLLTVLFVKLTILFFTLTFMSPSLPHVFICLAYTLHFLSPLISPSVLCAYWREICKAPPPCYSLSLSLFIPHSLALLLTRSHTFSLSHTVIAGLLFLVEWEPIAVWHHIYIIPFQSKPFMVREIREALWSILSI